MREQIGVFIELQSGDELWLDDIVTLASGGYEFVISDGHLKGMYEPGGIYE